MLMLCGNIVIVLTLYITICSNLDADGCKDGDIRTVSHKDRGEEGRVEVCFSGVWGAVYSVSAWNVNQVGVICREGGYEPAGVCA